MLIGRTPRSPRLSDRKAGGLSEVRTDVPLVNHVVHLLSRELCCSRWWSACTHFTSLPPLGTLFQSIRLPRHTPFSTLPPSPRPAFLVANKKNKLSLSIDTFASRNQLNQLHRLDTRTLFDLPDTATTELAHFTALFARIPVNPVALGRTWWPRTPNGGRLILALDNPP